jgi:hypothetical protein
MTGPMLPHCEKALNKMYDEITQSALASAEARIFADLRLRLPASSDRIADWLQRVHDGAPATAVMRPQAFPMILLPRFLEKSIAPPKPDARFREDVIFITLNLYYYLRFIDNIMDNDALADQSLLPALSFFHVNLQTPMQRYFDAGHPFWDFYLSTWLRCADVTIIDCGKASFGPEDFSSIAAKKTSAAKIALAAVCHRYGRTDLLPAWVAFHDVLGCWHQMWNDIRDWAGDERNGIVTYFLSEGRRRKRPGETIGEWVVREGYDWGLAVLDDWMREMKDQAVALGSPDLGEYLAQRDVFERNLREKIQLGLKNLGRLFEAVAL